MSEMHRFDEYTRKEAEAVAETFIRQARKMTHANVDTELWTEWVLDWFAGAASEKTVVDARRSRCSDGSIGRRSVAARRGLHPEMKSARPRTTGGEFLVDLCHTTFPKYGGDWGSRAYWERAFVNTEQAPAIHLALESEFGSSTSEELNLHRVMEDASKLLVLRARVKVMIFASVSPANRDEIVRLATQIAAHDRSGETTWVWIDLPWGASWAGEDGPQKWVLPTAPQN